jgi:hypothetical protein
MTFKLNQNQGGASDRVPTTNRELIEQTKLSRLPQSAPFRLPDLPQRLPLTFDNAPNPNATAVASACVGCSGRLDPDDSIQQSIKACRKCLTRYAVIDQAIDEASKRKRQEMLEKFAGGGNE